MSLPACPRSRRPLGLLLLGALYMALAVLLPKALGADPTKPQVRPVALEWEWRIGGVACLDRPAPPGTHPH